ncbi:MAG TPA: nitrate reductase molybdenum cofactor assembly chaperone [Burkholderiaceae bacterium]
MHTPRLTLRVLAALLDYPDAGFLRAVPELVDALDAEAALPASRRQELAALLHQLQALPPFEAEARYLETFDRGRATSLHLFEHVHGDSRDRGPALVDLGLTYERAGLALEGDELPDHLSVMLQFASTQPAEVAREFLGETAHILNAVFSALRERGSPYASALAAVLELAGHEAQAVPVAAEPAMDEAWAEPPAFSGCSSPGQAAPGAPQPVRIVRKSPVTPTEGARS